MRNIEFQLLNHQIFIQPMGLRNHSDKVTQLYLLDVHIQQVQIHSCKSDANREKSLGVQNTLTLSHEVFRKSDIVIFNDFHNTTIKSDSFCIFNIVLAIVHRCNGKPFFCLFVFGTERHNNRTEIFPTNLPNHIEKVLAKLNHLRIDVVIVCDIINYSLAINSASANITTQAIDEPVIEVLPCIFVVGISIKRIVVVRDIDDTYFELLSDIYVCIVVFNDCPDIILNRNVMILIRPLDRVKQIRKFPFTGHIAVTIKVLRIIEHPTRKKPLPILIDGDFRIHLPNLIQHGMGRRYFECESSRFIGFQNTLHIQKTIVRKSRIIEQAPVCINLIHYKHPSRKRTVAVAAPRIVNSLVPSVKTHPGITLSPAVRL